MSSWIFYRNRVDPAPPIRTDVVDWIKGQDLPGFRERINMLLLEMAQELENLGDQIYILEPRFFAATYTEKNSPNDLSVMAKALVQEGLIESAGQSTYRLTIKGHDAVEALTKQEPSKKSRLDFDY